MQADLASIKTSAPVHIISLGAGVQSSTMALMAAKGEITPMPTMAIFADTQGEPESVYKWLEWLATQLPFPVHVITRGSLADSCCNVKYSKKNGRLSFSGIPAFVKGEDAYGLIPRQCTRDFKIDPITKRVNQARKENGNTYAIQWIGISVDEVSRAKDHRNAPRIVNRFPLLEHRMRRSDCITWMNRNGYPEPPRSACVFCPYRSNSEWRRLKDNEPGEFQKAVVFEKRFQEALSETPMRGVPFLHRSMVPLSQVDFSTEEERGQLNMFENECEGMCGV